jgi:hypothetical protein
MVASLEPDASSRLSGEKATAGSCRELLSMTARDAHVSRCHSWIVPSSDPEVSSWPFGENATLVTTSPWPFNVATSQTFTERSRDEEAKVKPSVEKATAVTG